MARILTSFLSALNAKLQNLLSHLSPYLSHLIGIYLFTFYYFLFLALGSGEYANACGLSLSNSLISPSCF